MSARFYPRQTDYIVQLNALDDAAQLAITKGDIAAKWATQAAGEVVPGQGYSAYYYANQAGQSANQVNTGVALAQAWATQAAGVVNGTAFYSANYYATQSAASAASATTSATLAQNWATSMVSTFTGSGGLYGAKYYATAAQTSQTAAQNWATQASGEVATGQGYSAKYNAVAAAASATLAQSWASQVSGVVNGTAYYSAYYYATQAGTLAGSASQSVTDANTAKTAAQTAQTAAQSWATQASGEVVVGQGYSAKYSATASAASAALSQAWACQTSGVVNGSTYYSAYYYATQAKTYMDTVVAGQIQTDWNQTDNTQKDFIKNKPVDATTALASYGIGSVAASPLLSSLDDTTSGAGLYYTSATTTGTWPSGVSAGSGFVVHKVYGAAGFQMLQLSGAQHIYYRSRVSSAWGTWTEISDRAYADSVGNLKLALTGGTLTGALNMSGTAPQVIFNEIDQSGAVGKWRHMVDGGEYLLDRNTSAARDFSSYSRDFRIDTSGVVNIPQAKVATLNVTGVAQMANTVSTTASFVADALLYARNGQDGEIAIGTDFQNGAIEIGRTGRVNPGSPYIDFHSSPNSPDYDARIQVTGGNSTSGKGAMAITAASLTLNGASVQTMSQRNASNGYVGLTGQVIDFYNADLNYKSGLVNSNTAARAYTFPDKDITVAGTTNETHTNPTIKGYIEQFQALNSGAAVTINTANGTLIEITTTANITITLPAPVAGAGYTIIIIYGGAHTATFAIASGTLNWVGGTAPPATSVAGKKDTYSFLSGSTYTIGRDGGRNA